MSTPDSERTADGVEISVDRVDASRLQFSVADRHEGRAAWRLVTDLTAAEVAQLHGYLGDWLGEARESALDTLREWASAGRPFELAAAHPDSWEAGYAQAARDALGILGPADG